MVLTLKKLQPLNLIGLWLPELEELVERLGERPYRARQLAQWIYKRGMTDFERMTDFAKLFRQRLAEVATCERLVCQSTLESPLDRATKYLFELADGERIESVRIRMNEKITLCLSSQVGCPLACTFCATGDMGFRRNLTAGEIVSQVLQLREDLKEQKINNVVFMGMGEPLLNYEQVVKAIRIMTSELGCELPARRITVSTAGWVPGIYQLAEEKLKVKLAVSLNAPDEERRKKLMPVTRKYSLDELLKAAKHFAFRTRRRVTFEYVLMEGVNDNPADAHLLAKLVRGIPCKINLILYNPNKGQPYIRPALERVERFREILYPRAPAVTLRISKGWDIQAACGQLAADYPLRKRTLRKTVTTV